MHKVYQSVTEHNKYAVKKLNSSIMKRNHVIEHLVDSERISKALEKNVPVISAIQFNNNPLLILDGKYYEIFNWLDGKSIFPLNISLEKCIQMGKL